MRPVPPQAPGFVTKHESCVLRVYDDAAPKVVLRPGVKPVGTLTAGVGHTGPDVKIGLKVTQEMADAWLMADLGVAAERLWRKIGSVVEELTDNQYTALLSFVFNLGVDGKMANATIWKRLKSRQFDQVPAEMAKFVFAGGKKYQGLVDRRAAEAALFTDAEPGIQPGAPPSSVTRLMDTAPVPTDPTPARKSKSLWAAATSAVAAMLATAKDAVAHGVSWVIDFLTPDRVNGVIGAVQPYADKSHIVASAVSALAVVAATLTAFLALQKHNEARR